MPDTLLARMRHLKERAEFLNGTAVSDLQPFLHPFDKITFLRLPTSHLKKVGRKSKKEDIGVTVTCTAVMTACVTNTMKEVYGKHSKTKKRTVDELMDEVFRKLLAFRWASSDLLENNAFTAALVLRAASMCAERFDKLKRWRRKIRTCKDVKDRSKRAAAYENKTLERIARFLVGDGNPLRFKVGEYEPTPAIVYWCIDAIARLEITIDPKAWPVVAAWAATQLRIHASLIESKHQALMDPISLAMAACLCQNLRTIAKKTPKIAKSIIEQLPSTAEQEHAVDEFCKKQRPSGIWEKYFPMFHYPDAGANHCWAFEVLEALLNEFPKSIGKEKMLSTIERAVDWCETNRLKWFREDGEKFEGWNSGGVQGTLRSGQPESWATGVAHMFLTRAQEALRGRLSELVFEKYCRPKERFKLPGDPPAWQSLLDSPIFDSDGEVDGTVKVMIWNQMIGPILAQKSLRLPERPCKSALLFGPPGTGKTTFVKTIAKVIGWSFIELSPSVFLDNGIENIYRRADEVFDDLREVTRAVVFFDEMDALVQKRGAGDGATLDVTRQFLTTSMLPKLAQLHDSTQALIFFMATNHVRRFDAAIKRPGRFDLLICLSPPDWEEKIARLTPKFTDDWKRARSLLMRAVQNDDTLQREVELLTDGEFRGFLKECSGGNDLVAALSDLTADETKELLKRWTNRHMTLAQTTRGEVNEYRTEYEEDKASTCVQF